MIDRGGKPKQPLQEDMDPCGCTQVCAANDMRDGLIGVIADDREVVRGAHARARESHIACRSFQPSDG